MTIEIIQGDITTAQQVDAIVNPANSQGVMGGGVAAALKQAGGVEIETEARQHSPCPVGQAYLTRAGRLPVKAIIHAPTMTHPAEPIPPKHVELATTAALRLADDTGYQVIAMPGMGTGSGDVPLETAAQIMLDTIAMYMVDQQLTTVKLYALDDGFYNILKRLHGD